MDAPKRDIGYNVTQSYLLSWDATQNHVSLLGSIHSCLKSPIHIHLVSTGLGW